MYGMYARYVCESVRAYEVRVFDEAFNAFKNCLKAGERAPDGALVDAATGETVRLSKLWDDPLVLEFGSYT